MKEIFKIRDKVSNGELDAKEAFWQLLDLLTVGGSYTRSEISAAWIKCKEEKGIGYVITLQELFSKLSNCGLCKGENWINEGVWTKPCPSCGGKQRIH